MIARRLPLIALLAIIALTPRVARGQTNMAFNGMAFPAAPFYIRSATRVGNVVTVTFQTNQIPPTPLQRLGAEIAPPVSGGDPCAAYVEMFQAAVHNLHSNRGVRKYRGAKGVFCWPTIFVGTTVFSVAGGPGSGAGGGYWFQPVTQDVLGADMIDYRFNPIALWVPPGTQPWSDGTSWVGNEIVFGASSEFMLFEDCPAISGIHDGVPFGSDNATLLLNDRLQYRLVFRTFFDVMCPGAGGPVRETEVSFDWQVLDSLVVGMRSVKTTETSMVGSLVSTSVRPSMPSVSGSIILDPGAWPRVQ